MDDALKRIYAACNPDQPATPQYYVDCRDVRGETSLALNFLSHLEGARASRDNYIHFLFSGHIGCGKSSELAHLSHLLKGEGEGGFASRYLPVTLNVSDYLDDYDVSMTDIVLAVVTEIAATLREELRYQLKDSYFKSRFTEIKDFFLSDIEINKAEVEVLGAKLEIQRLKSSPEARRLVREKLVHTESRLLDEVNRVFEEARLAVQRARDSQGRQKYEDLVLIFDNLEKIQRFEGREEGLASQREFFLERSAQLSSLRIHTILTVPLRLVRSVDGPQLTQRHGSEPYVLPMVKVIQRGTRAPYEPGLERVRAMLRKRLGNLTLDEALTTEAQAFLLNYSGGHTRNLVNFLRNACAYAQAAPIPLRAVQQAVLQTVRTYSAAIPESHWDKLATLELSSEQQIVNGDPDYLKMLENLSVLEYINGGGPDFSFQASEQWYAVNPLVRELTRFKEAVQRLGA